jgi:putative FmdB family regulatory protein
MPIYEYNCNDCGRDFDLLVIRHSEADSQECPHCGSQQVTRKMSSFASVGSSTGSGGLSSGQSCGST